MEIRFGEELLQFIKAVALIFALFHLLVGFVLVRRVSRINKIIHTSKAGLITLINFIYLGVLIFVLILIALI